ncbi:PREDICTED: cysteine-rich DPF motif domain-containing protein 1 isoform X2 [Mandrillus leucophaeus]|uniref:cysteine-rich DPF motif domain-containing protein 1 isoform X2 n=1 Tax=Mandrillus leucophaeus TaxID=9568 RepID=UPI0005F56A2C|nr:PREDICTED: cysteine-rich DPF motif domain-containing protein 1 isoform X2 [Mandrillus leucophaeus]
MWDRSPPTPSRCLLEESYVMKDPFTSHRDRFLVLGSRCSLCSRLVCVGPVGVQLILLQEILPPLCPGEHQCFSSGNSARLGEKESSIKEDPQPARFSDVSAARAGHRAAPCTELLGQPAPGMLPSWELPCLALFLDHWEQHCSPGELESSLEQPQAQGASCSKRVAQRQMPDKTQPGTWPGVPTCPSGPRPE